MCTSVGWGVLTVSSSVVVVVVVVSSVVFDSGGRADGFSCHGLSAYVAAWVPDMARLSDAA